MRKRVKQAFGHTLKGVGMLSILLYLQDIPFTTNLSITPQKSNLEFIIDEEQSESMRFLKINREENKKLYNFLEDNGYLREGEYKVLLVEGE